MSTIVELYSHLPPLTDIKWGPRLGYEYFNGGSSEIQKDFLAPDFYLNCFFFFFFVSFFLFNKRILLLILLTQTRQSFFVVEVLYLSKTLYLRRKASQLAVLTFNNSPITHLVVWKCGSAREFVISVTLNSVGKPQPTSVPCVNWWTWQEQTAPCKLTGYMAAWQYIYLHERLLSCHRAWEAKIVPLTWEIVLKLKYLRRSWFFPSTKSTKLS